MAFFRKPAVRSLLVRALLIGLTAINPALGGVANLSYTSYSYGRTGKELWDGYQEWKNKKIAESKQSVGSAAGDLTRYATASYAGEGAGYIVDKAEKAGVIDEIHQKTNIGKPVIREMLKGTSSQAISNKFSNLAGFVVSKL